MSARRLQFARGRASSLLLGLVLASSFVAAAIATTAAATPQLTKGPIPDAAWTSGTMDVSLLPDFVEAIGRDGAVAGYVSKRVILDPTSGLRDSQGRPAAAIWPVYADDLWTVVGYLVPDKGFIPVGVDPKTIEAAPAVQAPAP